MTHTIDVLPESLENEKSIWEYYNEMAAVEDNIREVEWRDLADTVLVFVCIDTQHGVWLLIWFQDGLFAAFLSAFLVFLIPQLQTNSTDVAMDVLIHISQQLSNSTTPAFEPAAFQVSPNAAAVNMLFFLSLALVLIDAFLAMLVKGWLQEFDRGWRTYTVAHLRAQERERRLKELERWKLHELVALLPILIQGSLLLFCIGLLVLIFPLHQPSGILCSLLFVSVVGFYGLTTYVSIINNYAPFSSPVSRLLARGLAMLQTWHIPITHNTRRIISAISFHKRPTLSPHGRRVDADASEEITQPLPSNNGMAKSVQPHNPDNAEKSKMVPRSHSGIDPQMHVHVLERLVTTTDEVVENIPIFLELLDQPVKYPTLRPLNLEKWKELLHITLRLLGDQSSLPVSAACTLARTMMICYDHETPDEQLSLTLEHHLGSRDADNRRPRKRLNVLFSSYLLHWLGSPSWSDLWRTIAFLEPGDAADAELLWMVNTFHRTMHFVGDEEFRSKNYIENRLDTYLGFFAAVLTYISSTEQSRRSKVPLTAAVIYALHTVRSAIKRREIDYINRLYILPGNVSTSEPVFMTFCHVDGNDALNLWSQECIQFVRELLQWDWPAYWLNDFRRSLIAALYIDSTKQAHARSTFADLLEHTSIADIALEFSDAYDDDKLVVYSYMAVSQKPLTWDHDLLYNLFVVIDNTIYGYSTLQLSGLRILEMALKHVRKLAASTSNWLIAGRYSLIIDLPGHRAHYADILIDYWVLLHLETLLPPQPFLPPEDVKKLEWSDTPEEVYISSARLDLYDSLAKTEHEGAIGLKPDPELLRVFLRSNDHGVCTRAFNWCLDLVPISQFGTPGDANSTRIFIPETMGYGWAAHFIHVLCKGEYMENIASWEFLKSRLVPKWAMLPSSWCHDFASAVLFTVVKPLEADWLPAYQCLEEANIDMSLKGRQAFLPFLATLLELIKYRLTLDSIISLENWLAQLPARLENQDAHAQMEGILATRKQQLPEENLGFFAELPMADEWMEEVLEFLAELPMAGEWMDE